jgi:hypothetical protein
MVANVPLVFACNCRLQSLVAVQDGVNSILQASCFWQRMHMPQCKKCG